jgi:hypothetical protein
MISAMCGRIVDLDRAGVYNGGYEVVRLAIEGK